ncbi:hypothetical protein A6764_22175 [Brevibacillus sp. WF146]|uniref:hypothetical protein n=1 Tax=Brevibacillus sp. WF146 TaxID=319501 RepID=UPI0007ED2DEB|nr:hypothetical protein [Brevibacillus sp. WF146]UYZ12129.1 hypothetical protein A6764_14980 [Brevibacillus sp. WF146]UYZ13416.1 hypothetical protein A6764_22175 [Brevibacillus sp. WF146]
MKTFLNDQDGLSEKDYLLLVSTTVFFLFVAVGLVLVLMGRTLDPMYVTLLDMVAPVLMTVAGGVYGVRAVQEFRKQPQTADEVPPRREEEDNRGTTSPI